MATFFNNGMPKKVKIKGGFVRLQFRKQEIDNIANYIRKLKT